MCDPRHLAFFKRPPRAATALRNSLVLLTLADGFVFSPLAVKRTFFVQIQSTRLVLPLVLITHEETLLQLANATNSCCVRSAFFHISFHHVFSHAGNAGSRRVAPPRSSRMFTPRCGGKKRGTHEGRGPAFRLRLGVPHAFPRLQPRQQFPRLPLRCPRSKVCLLVSAPGAAAKGGVLQLTMHTSTRARAPSLSHRLHRLTWYQRPPCHTPSSLTGFRPVDCPKRLRVDDAFWSDQEYDKRLGRPLAHPAVFLGKQTCYSRLSPLRRSGTGPRVLGKVAPSLSWSCSWF